MKGYDANIINKQRAKNKKIWSGYLYMLDANKDKDKALVTFTTSKITTQEKLDEIREIKKYFSKLMNNLKIEISQFSVIELGSKKNNPHLHVQLFFDSKDFSKIEKVYNKTIEKFNLIPKRCKLSSVDKSKTHIKYFSYILKEYSTKFSDKELMDLIQARNSIKGIKNKFMQFVSSSHHVLTKPLYKHLYFKFNISYLDADFLAQQEIFEFKKSFNKRHYGVVLHTHKIVLSLLYIISWRFTKKRQKRVYSNKKKIVTNFNTNCVIFKHQYGFT